MVEENAPPPTDPASTTKAGDPAGDDDVGAQDAVEDCGVTYKPETDISETSGDDFITVDEIPQYAEKLAKTLSRRRKRPREAILQFMEKAPFVKGELASNFLPFEYMRGDDMEVLVVDIVVRKVRDVFKVSYRSRFSVFVDEPVDLPPPTQTRTPWKVNFKPGAVGGQVMWSVGPARPPDVKDPTEAINRVREKTGELQAMPARFDRMPMMPSLDVVVSAPRRRARGAGQHSRSTSSLGSWSTVAPDTSKPTGRRTLSAWDLGTSMPRPIGLGQPVEGIRECAVELTTWSCGQAPHGPMTLRTPGPGAYDNFWSAASKHWTTQRGVFAAGSRRRPPCAVTDLDLRDRFEARKKPV